MAKIVQLHRMVSSLAATYVGPQGEVIGDLGANSLRYQDGATPGGFLLMQGANNLAELTNLAQARTNLDVDIAGTAATLLSIFEGLFQLTQSGDGPALTGAVNLIIPCVGINFILKSGFALPNPDVTVAFPAAFPAKLLGCGAWMMQSTSGGVGDKFANAYPIDKTSMQISSNAGGGGFQACWIAWGI